MLYLTPLRYGSCDRSATINSSPTTHIVIFKTQIRNATHRERLALGQVLVNLVDAARHVAESLIEEITSTLLEVVELVTGFCALLLGMLGFFLRLV